MSAAAVSMAAAEQKKPNILIIMVDDMGWSDLGCYGGEIRTPHIDSLAANGVRFRRFFNNAKCAASRISLLMGRSNIGASQRTYNNPTLGHVLKQAGYHTYASGKNHSRSIFSTRALIILTGFGTGCVTTLIPVCSGRENPFPTAREANHEPGAMTS